MKPLNSNEYALKSLFSISKNWLAKEIHEDWLCWNFTQWKNQFSYAKSKFSFHVIPANKLESTFLQEVWRSKLRLSSFLTFERQRNKGMAVDYISYNFLPTPNRFPNNFETTEVISPKWYWPESKEQIQPKIEVKT